MGQCRRKKEPGEAVQPTHKPAYGTPSGNHPTSKARIQINDAVFFAQATTVS